MTQQIRAMALDEYELDYDAGMGRIYIDCKRCDEFVGHDDSPVLLQSLLQIAANHEFSTHMK